MSNSKNHPQQEQQKESFVFEEIHGEKNAVKAKTYRDGKVHEILVVAPEEEVFEQITKKKEEVVEEELAV